MVSAVSAQGSSGPTGAGLEESDSAAQPESLRPEEPNSPAQSESRKSEEPDIAEQSETLRSKEAPVIPPRKTARRTLDPAGMRSSRGLADAAGRQRHASRQSAARLKDTAAKLGNKASRLGNKLKLRHQWGEFLPNLDTNVGAAGLDHVIKKLKTIRRKFKAPTEPLFLNSMSQSSGQGPRVGQRRSSPGGWCKWLGSHLSSRG